MPAYIASIVAACIATSFTAANGEGVPQVASLPASSSFLSNPPVAYLVAAPITSPPTPSEIRAQRVRARAARQAQSSASRSTPYSPPSEQSVVEGFAAPSTNTESTQPENNGRLGATPRSNRARQRNNDLRGLDLSGMTPTQIRDLKSFINLAQGSATNSVSPFLAPIVPITAEDLARIQEHLLNDNAKSENAKIEGEKADTEDSKIEAIAESAQAPSGASVGTTLIDRPVFVDRQGGPLVIIQQHAHHQEDEIDALHADVAEETESASAEIQSIGDEATVSHVAEMEPIEYVPFALIDRDGRVAILERSNKMLPVAGSGVPETTEHQAPSTSREPKQLPPAIRKQLEEGRLPPPSFMFGSHTDNWPSSPPKSQALDENNKDYYLAPAYNRASQNVASTVRSNEGTPILIRMPNSSENAENKEWNPTALLLGKGPATLRRAIEVDSASNESEQA